MRRRTRPLRAAAASGLILFSALAAISAARSYTVPETPAAAATLERIARKNDAAAMRSAAAMEARAAIQTNRHGS